MNELEKTLLLAKKDADAINSAFLTDKVRKEVLKELLSDFTLYKYTEDEYYYVYKAMLLALLS